MEKEKILELIKKNINYEDLEKAKNILNKNYFVSYGNYDNLELKKALSEKKPVIIKNNFLTGFDEGKNIFVNFNNEKITIDRMVKALIIEDEKEESSKATVDDRPLFVIIGKVESWIDEDILLFQTVFSALKIGEIWLPPHSAIFNFLQPSKEEKKEKIVSELAGVQINVYSADNFVDNCIHEIGHLFWRDCLNHDERKSFKMLFEHLKPSAIYEYSWERSDGEEVFCTIYKWYVKSLLISKSFYNILDFEEPDGLKLLQNVLDRIAKDRIIADVWDVNKEKIFNYLNPKFDITTEKFIRKVGVLDEIKEIVIPEKILSQVDRVKDGIEFVNLGKAIVPVQSGRIDFENLSKARMTKYKKKEPDGYILDAGHVNPTFEKDETLESFKEKKEKILKQLNKE